jgi:hypothetical protein
MANYNFGIDCKDKSSAEELSRFISKLNIYQDGLDRQDVRVMLVSKSSLIEELKKYAKKHGGLEIVEVWPSDLEYDEAESSGSLEVHQV